MNIHDCYISLIEYVTVLMDTISFKDIMESYGPLHYNWVVAQEEYLLFCAIKPSH